MTTENSRMIEEQKLDFDRDNPRLVEFQIGPKATDDEIIQILWDEMDAGGIANSILASGFFQNDPLIVEPNGERFVVLEGNRRLAAVRVIKNPEKYKKLASVPTIPATFDLNGIEKLPVFVQDRADSWRILGFKHVNGPAKWGSYAKAKYVAEVHDKYGVSLDDIARTIGDTNKVVKRLYMGLMVLEQAEVNKLWNREDATRSSLPFSHLYTGLNRDGGIRKHLAISDDRIGTRNPVPDSKMANLKELCVWLFGSKKDDRKPIIQSQNPDLGLLDTVLDNLEATGALRAGESLQVAFELTRPAQAKFEDALLEIKRNLITARGLVTEGYDGMQTLLLVARTIQDLAADLHADMKRKADSGERR